MRLRDRFIDAGLGKAMEEVGVKAPCKNAHSMMHKKSGWSFCPHCGEKLEILKHCEWCNKDFYSDSAYRTHVMKAHKTLRNIICPDCKCRMSPSNTKRRGVKTYHCDRCERHYHLKPDGNLYYRRGSIAAKNVGAEAIPQERKEIPEAPYSGQIDWDQVEKDLGIEHDE